MKWSTLLWTYFLMALKMVIDLTRSGRFIRGKGVESLQGEDMNGRRPQNFKPALKRPFGNAVFFNFIFICLLTAFFIDARKVLAEEPAGGVRTAAEMTLTLEDVWKMTLLAGDDIRIAGEGVAQAQASVDKALSTFLPRITAETGITKYSDRKVSGSLVTQPDDSARFDLKITQPLYTGGTEWSARRLARMRLEKSGATLGYARQSAMLRAARAFFSVLKSQKDMEIKRAALKRAEERRKVATARFKVGEVTRSAVLRAEAETANGEAELIRAESAIRDAKSFLKRTLNVTEDLNVVEPEAFTAANASEEALIKTAYENRLDYKGSVLDQKLAGEGITYAKGNFLPSVRLEGAYDWKKQNPTTAFLVEDSVNASVVLSYPLFEGGLRKAELSEARSKLRESELRRHSLMRDIEVEVRQAYNSIESARAVIDAYKKQLSFAEEDYKMVFEQFKFGIATTVDVIDADSTLISAQRSLMNSSYDLQLAILELNYSTGVLSPGIQAPKRSQ